MKEIEALLQNMYRAGEISKDAKAAILQASAEKDKQIIKLENVETTNAPLG